MTSSINKSSIYSQSQGRPSGHKVKVMDVGHMFMQFIACQLSKTGLTWILQGTNWHASLNTILVARVSMNHCYVVWM